ncbi:MAG: hypothetical protein KatS3mg103_0133 [Phycisphaerales bacterium]|nr:MAG: hypothetical protein KatS3mg103_0133 [Phycisphaerales bacterium]
MKGLLPAWALAWREVRRFSRQPLRIAVAVLTPAMVWLFLTSGFGGAIRPEALGQGVESLALYLLPGMASLVVLLNAVFASISLIEDRHEGFLQAVLVSPAPRWSVAVGKLLGGGLVGMAQAAVLLCLSPVVGADPGAGGLGAAVLALACLSLGITGIGLALAWWVDSTAGFHGVMNLLLMPAWLLSGAVFPVQGASGWLRAVAAYNPLSWCHQAVGSALIGRLDVPALTLSGLFAAGGVAACVGVLALRGARRPIGPGGDARAASAGPTQQDG